MTMLVAKFVVPGEPVSKARARFTKRGSKTVAYTPQRTLDGEQAVAAAFLAQTRKKGTSKELAYAVHIRLYNGTRQRRDVDNMVKLVLDGLNGIAWPDDNQVTEISAKKLFVAKEEARTEVEVFEVGDMDFPKSKCLFCGLEFRTYSSWESGSTGRKYCSQKCGYDHRVARRLRTCEQCGSSFHAWGESKQTRFCSIDCNSASKRAIVRCDCCGADFSKQRSHVRKTNYCSPECQEASALQRRQERKSSRFPGTCIICGAGTTRKEYLRCNPCKKQNASGKSTITRKEVP